MFFETLRKIEDLEHKYNQTKLALYIEVNYDFISKNFTFLENLDRQIIFVIDLKNKLSENLTSVNIDDLINFQKIVNITSTLKYPMHFKNIDNDQLEFYYKNNFKGGIYDFQKYSYQNISNTINDCYQFAFPCEKQVQDAIDILEMAVYKEGKYVNENSRLVKNSNMCGAFKMRINQSYSENINEDILIDKASILIYKKILSRYFFLKMNEKNDSAYVIDKETDLKIIKIGFNHTSVDNVPIDFTEWDIDHYVDIFSTIRLINQVTGVMCSGKYEEDKEMFVYDIKLFSDKKAGIPNLHIKGIKSDEEWIKPEVDKGAVFSDKIQNIFPCNNSKFVNFSLQNDFNHILDLEDSVSYFEKSKARDTLVNLFTDTAFIYKIKDKYIWIRINAINSSESLKDIIEVLSRRCVLENIKGIILPKVNHPEELEQFFLILRTIEQSIWEQDSTFIRGRLLIQVLIESCEGLHNLKQISENLGITSFISGLYDYKNSVGSWDIFNQYPSLIYQKKEVIDICKKKQIISVESITPVLDFDKSFTESLISYSINFITKWSVYPTHIKGSNYSKNLSLFF